MTEMAEKIEESVHVERLIIENRKELPMKDALPYALQGVEMGRNGGPDKTQYTFMTGWPDGIRVTASQNEKSDRLVVDRE